ncbi:hypothetical protein V6Z12_D08G079700 [Gossypium hirsutum]
MLKSQDLQINFGQRLFVPQFTCAVYLLNISSTRAILNRTPFEVWIAFRPCNPINGKIIIRRDVEFGKESCWKWESRQEVLEEDPSSILKTSHFNVNGTRLRRFK